MQRDKIFPNRSVSEAILLFQAATQELIQRRLFYMCVVKKDQHDLLGMYTTELGSAVIKKMWPEFFAKTNV